MGNLGKLPFHGDIVPQPMSLRNSFRYYIYQNGGVIVYNWETATYGKIWDIEDVHDLGSVETEFSAIVFNDTLTSEATLSCEPTVSSLNDNEIEFRISFDESNDEDYTVIYDKNSVSYKIKMNSENDNEKVNMPSFPLLEPAVSCFDDLDFFKDFKNEFPAIVYNDTQTSKSDLLTEQILYPQHINEFDSNNETSLSECDKEEQNILKFNYLFSFNVIYPNDSKSDEDNDDDKVDIEHSSGDLSVKPLPDVINTDVGAYTHGSNKLLETSHDTNAHICYHLKELRSERPSKPQSTPSPPHPSEAHVEPQSDLSPGPSPTIPIHDPIREGSGGNLGSQSSSDKSLSGSEGSLTLPSVYDLYLSLCTQGLLRERNQKQKKVFEGHHRGGVIFKQVRKTIKYFKGAPTSNLQTLKWDDLDHGLINYATLLCSQMKGKNCSTEYERKIKEIDMKEASDHDTEEGNIVKGKLSQLSEIMETKSFISSWTRVSSPVGITLLSTESMEILGHFNIFWKVIEFDSFTGRLEDYDGIHNKSNWIKFKIGTVIHMLLKKNILIFMDGCKECLVFGFRVENALASLKSKWCWYRQSHPLSLRLSFTLSSLMVDRRIAKDVKETLRSDQDLSECLNTFSMKFKESTLKKHEVKQVQQSCLWEDY
ncbi:hypothetical protein Tco_0396034 [Tanacetum coccineum]